MMPCRQPVFVCFAFFASAVVHAAAPTQTPQALFGRDIAVGSSPACDAAFAEARLEGAFVLYVPHEQRLALCNPDRAATRYLPASTFKIPNALIALETGAIADEHETFHWDGVERRVASWNRDHDLASGFALNVDLPQAADAPKRLALTRRLPAAEGLIPRP